MNGVGAQGAYRKGHSTPCFVFDRLCLSPEYLLPLARQTAYFFAQFLGSRPIILESKLQEARV